MSGKPRNFSQAIDELEDHGSSNGNGNGADIRARLESELRRIEETLKNMKPHLDDLTEKVGGEARKAKKRVEDQVSENPWAALGVVGLVFFVLGFLFGFGGGRGRRD